MERVVITGMGLVTPSGIGTEETWRSVLAAESGIAQITLFDASSYSTRFAGEVKGFVGEDWIPKKKLKEMGRFAHLSVAASTLCLKDSGIELTDEDRDECGTFIGVGLGGLEQLQQQAVTLFTKGPSKISPYFIPTVIANLAAGQVAMALNLRGVSYCNTQSHENQPQEFRLHRCSFSAVLFGRPERRCFKLPALRFIDNPVAAALKSAFLVAGLSNLNGQGHLQRRRSRP